MFAGGSPIAGTQKQRAVYIKRYFHTRLDFHRFLNMVSQLFLIAFLSTALSVLSLPWQESVENELMTTIEKEELERERCVMRYEASSEFVKLICLLNETVTVPVPLVQEHRINVIILPTDEKRSELYVALRNVAAYFKIALCADNKVKKTLWSEKTRASNELKRAERHLATVEDSSLDAEAKGKIRMAEESMKIKEASERAQSIRQESTEALNSLQYDCVKTNLVANCRWLGNYKRRLQKAENFENITLSELNQNSRKHVIAQPYEAQKIKNCIEEWTTKLAAIEANLEKLQPKTGLLKAIDRAIGMLFRRDETWIFSRSPAVSKNSLHDFLNLAQEYYSRFVENAEMNSHDPAYIMARLTPDQISHLSKNFIQLIHELDFATMLDYDD